MKKTQTDRILDYMEEFGAITPVEAMRDLGVMRLAARISDLKRMGYPIRKETRQGKNRFGEKTYYANYILEG